MKTKGNFDQFKNGILEGWIHTEDSFIPEIHINGQMVGLIEIESLYYRKDVDDAGITSAKTGFTLDLNDEISKNSLSGNVLVSVNIGGIDVFSEYFRLPSQFQYVENSDFRFNERYEIADAELFFEKRIGVRLERLLGKPFSNQEDWYTRIYTKEAKPSKNNIRLCIPLKPLNNNESSEHALKLSITAKSSINEHISLCIKDQEQSNIFIDHILLDSDWQTYQLQLPPTISQRIKESFGLQIEVKFKHRGKFFVDLAQLIVSESLLPQNKEATKKSYEESDLNWLVNGDLKRWNNGLDFTNIDRGDYITGGWILEHSKHNINMQILSIETNSTTKYTEASDKSAILPALRVQTKQLQGYSRITIELINKPLLSSDYELEIHIRPFLPNNVSRLKRIFLISQTNESDHIIHSFDEKVLVDGSKPLKYRLTHYQVTSIREAQKNANCLCLLIELDSNSDIVIIRASLRVAAAEIQKNALLQKTEYQLPFEDSNINAQLKFLKGVSLWHNEVKMKKNITQEVKPARMQRPYLGYPSVDIIIPVYNALEDVNHCLLSIIENTDIVHRVIIVNDGSDSETFKALKTFESRYPHFILHNNEENQGYTKSVNTGIRLSKSDWVVVLNSDTIVSKAWLSKLINATLKLDNPGMIGPLSNAASWQSVPNISDEKGEWDFNPLPEGLTVNNFAELVEKYSLRAFPSVKVINGFCQVISRAMLENIGLLDEIAFPKGYGEENDMCARAIKAGYKLYIADDTYVFHSKSKSFGHSLRKELSKSGSIALKEKHPDVNWNVVTEEIKNNRELNILRQKLREGLAR